MYFSLIKTLFFTGFLYSILFFSTENSTYYLPEEQVICPNITCAPYSVDLQGVNFDTALTLRISDLSPNYTTDLIGCDQTFYMSVRNAQGQTLLSAPDSVNLSCAFFAEANTFRISNLANGGDNYCWSSLTVSNSESVSCSGRFQDSIALVNFYRNAGGPDWPQTWDLNQPMDTWEGIQLNSTNRVKRLLISNLPEPVGLPRLLPDLNLSELEVLRLTNDHFSGEIPNFSKLPSLQTLDLSQNPIGGVIPDFSKLTNLEFLVLQSLNLNGPIPDFSNLPAIIYLDINNNPLTGTLPDFSNIPTLQFLALGYMDLNGPVPDFSNLPNLVELHLSTIPFSGVCPDFSNLPKLRRLSIGNTLLSGTIPDFTNLPALIYLSLGGNKFTGCPPNMVNSPLLEELRLSGNKLDCLNSNYNHLSSLKYLSLNENQYTHEDFLPYYHDIQNHITNNGGFGAQFYPQHPIPFLSPLVGEQGATLVIDLSVDDTVSTNNYHWYKNEQLIQTIEGNNELIIEDFQAADAGTYHCEISNSTPGLEVISTEDITVYFEAVPNAACRTADSLALAELYLSTGGEYWKNSWDLQLPMENWFGVYLNESGCVECLDLDGLPECGPSTRSGNRLTGSLPNLNLPNLQSLYLGQNQLIGIHPDLSFPSLQSLYLGYNRLTGTLPDLNLPNLQFLYIDGNELSGNLPDFSHLSNLLVLRLTNNKLSGPIPDFSNLPSLSALFLDKNVLIGTIPNFSYLSSLQELDLNENQLEGSIPDFSNIPFLNIVSFSNNQLTGPIPDFSNADFIQFLYLEDNQLSGSIPDFTNLPYLRELYLSNNKLEGCLPSFSNTPNLKWINVDNNKLNCEIPDLAHLTGLKQLYIDHNQLTFEDLLPTFNSITNLISNNSVGIAEKYQYSPQEKFFPESLMEGVEGEPLTIDLVIDNAIVDNTYQWFKNGALFLELQGINQLTFDELQPDDAGIYYCVVTNPNAPELTLTSREITLVVNEAPLETCDDINLTFNQSSIPEGIHRAAEMIESSGTVTDKTSVTFVAGQRIRLLPGFQTGNQVTFRAYIEDCEITTAPTAVNTALPEARVTIADNKPLELSIFPNPGRSQVDLQYQLSEPTAVSIFITDLNGKVVRKITDQNPKEAGLYSTRVDLQELASGLYIVQLSTTNHRVTKKLSVIK